MNLKPLFICLFVQLIRVSLSVQLKELRRRRQVDVGNGPQIDLNVTVPYIFSARLYPYGPGKDQVVQKDPASFGLQSSLKLLKHTYNSIFVHKDGFTSFASDAADGPVPLIAVYWMKAKQATVYYRETTDPTILNVAQNEVNIQYRYGADFKPSSVAIITWETNDGKADGNIFQLALILGDKGCFAHIVYSKLTLNSDAVAGFTSDDETSVYFALPGSGTSEAIQLVEKSNIGIPGEWLFRIDADQIYLCGAGFQGLECVDSCQPNQWYLDCSRQCHCADGNSCDSETGECPEGRCNPGWTHSPTCDEDIDECALKSTLCPVEQPDCVNTPGAYLCLCFEYDNSTNSCLGTSREEVAPAPTIAVPVMSLSPQLTRIGQPEKPASKATSRRPRPTIPYSETPLMTTTTSTPTPPPARTSSSAPPVFAEETDCHNCHAHARCQDNRCQCMLGWKGDGFTCEDVDECSNPLTCGSNAECQNTIGSYQCVCNVGFIATPEGCKDVDECAEGIVTCRDNRTACVNTVGSYECRCREGFQGDASNECHDVNECENATYYCGTKSTCVNSMGSYRCECLEGYEHLGNACVDINECLHNPCDSAAVCSNLEGSFKCECIEGFVGDGITCHETILYPTPNAVAVSNSPVVLNEAVMLFGNRYSKMYVSESGVVSFDRPFFEPIADAHEIRSVAFFPLYRPRATGTVNFVEINENDANNYSLMTRASLTVQNKIKQTDFRAKALYIVTFRQNSGTTFQLVLARSVNTTYVTYLFEHVEADSEAISGISHNGGFFSIPTELLTSHSNIGQNGKWSYRVDRSAEIGVCPAGLLGAPLCQQDCPPGSWGFDCANKCHCANEVPCDFSSGYCANNRCVFGFRGSNCYDDVDECAEGVSQCHKQATCTNTVGSYRCSCKAGFYGDGFACTEADKCQLRFGEQCSTNGYCNVVEDAEPECVCNPGFAGNGRVCTRQETPPTLPVTRLVPSTTTERVTTGRLVEPESVTEGSMENIDEHPFVMNNWLSSESTSKTTTSSSTTTSTSSTAMTTRTRTTTKSQLPEAKDYSDIDNNIFEESTIDDDNDDNATLFVVVLPIVLCLIWLILMGIILAVCCRKKQRRRANKYNLEMMGWSPRDYTSPNNASFSHFAYT